MNKLDNLKNDNAIIDMHVHTYYSDGDQSPNEILQLAFKKGIQTLSITDHDSIESYKNITLDFDKTKINLITGVELSADVDKGLMHILGYGIDINNLELNRKLNELKNISFNRIFSLLEILKKKYGIYFSIEEVRFLANSNHVLGRPDIAKLCVKNGLAKTVQEAFDKYLISYYDEVTKYNKKMSYQECIKLILDSGGIPVLAHPVSLKLSELELLKLLKEMLQSGLQGIEVYHSDHSIEDVKNFELMAKEFNILVSGGSDFHGITVKPNVEMGSGKNNNLKLKHLSILNKLK